MMKPFASGLCLLAGIAAVFVAGCMMENPHIRHQVAKRIATPAFMVERQIPTQSFVLTAFERMHKRHAPANVYIEGEGLAWLDNWWEDDPEDRAPAMQFGSKMSENPTPANPVGVHLASRDLAKNLVYLGRPCQYLTHAQEKDCAARYWTTGRFAPEVIASYEEALNEIKRRYDIESFNLIGFGGGGTIAALLAARRDDVTSLRTVAASLDHETAASLNAREATDDSLNPPDYADILRRVPQYHFAGGQDKAVPPAVLQSYLQALGDSPCVHYEFIQEASHEEGWVDKWPELLARDLSCEMVIPETEFMFEDFEMPEPIHTTPDRPLKP